MLKNNKFEVLTPEGFKDFKGITQTHRLTYSMLLSNGYCVECTDNHQLYEKELGWVDLRQLCEGDLIQTDVGFQSIKSITESDEKLVYDLIDVNQTKSYFTNGILSHNCSLVYIDECAFIPRDMEFYESTYPVISSGKRSRIIITSTPNGQRGLFYKLWTESIAGKNTYQPTMVKWNEVPGRDEEWKRTSIANTSEAQFKQEHELSFRGSQNSLINGEHLEKLVVHEIIDVIHGVNVYEEPVRGERHHQYMMTVDVSRGLGGDYSTFSVFDISVSPFKQVATYRNNKISPILYPSVIYNTAMHYNKALVLVEINDIGEQVASILHNEYEYDNLLTTIKEKTSYTIGFSSDAMYGVRTTTKVKSTGIATLETMIRNNLIEIVDNETIAELGTFVPKRGSYEADTGAHDDMVMTLVLFAWATVQGYFIDLTNKNLRASVIESFSDQALEELTPFGIIDDEFGEFDGAYKGGEGWFAD